MGGVLRESLGVLREFLRVSRDSPCFSKKTWDFSTFWHLFKELLYVLGFWLYPSNDIIIILHFTSYLNIVPGESSSFFSDFSTVWHLSKELLYVLGFWIYSSNDTLIKLLLSIFILSLFLETLLLFLQKTWDFSTFLHLSEELLYILEFWLHSLSYIVIVLHLSIYHYRESITF